MELDFLQELFEKVIGDLGFAQFDSLDGLSIGRLSRIACANSASEVKLLPSITLAYW
jgi:hypothetical protein